MFGTFKHHAMDATKSTRQYILDESIQQYKDYYESDKEEQTFFEFLNELPNREKIRMMEIFEDHTLMKLDAKEYAMIAKREFNPELSIFQNLIFDLVDFKDRVRPLAKDMALLDISAKHQRLTTQEIETNKANNAKLLKESGMGQEYYSSMDDGHSSREIEAPKEQSIKKY